MNIERILEELNPEQRKAATTLKGPVLVLAGAGTGKTRVITCRIAYMLKSGIAPEQILGLTFTNKAAREMRERLSILAGEEPSKLVWLGTFHAFCAKLLRSEITRLGYLPGFAIADDADQSGLLKQAAANLGIKNDKFPLAEVSSLIGKWKNRLLDPAASSRIATGDFEMAAAALYREYQNLLELQNMVDFDDMLFLALKIITKFPEVLEKYRKRYQYLLVDEYQDTNDVQFKLVNMLAGSEHNIFVVGDDDQSIYSWRGANISNILDFESHFPGAQIFKLEQNYRSTSNILRAANRVIGISGKRHAKNLWSELGEGDKITVTYADDGPAEAELISGIIHQQVAEDPQLHFSDFAILYRSNHLSREFEINLRRNKIPYRLVGGKEFYKRKEIRDAAAYLKILTNSRDDQSLLRILNTPARGLGDKAVNELKNRRGANRMPMLQILGEKDYQAFLGGKGASSAVEFTRISNYWCDKFKEGGNLSSKIISYLQEIGYLNGLQKIYKDSQDAAKRQENVYEFINSAAQFDTARDGNATLEDFLESFALLEENDKVEEEQGSNAVTLSTIHAAKGLEYPIVFLPAMERGLFPHERAVEEGNTDEELRLFYVALTRAKRKLFLTRAANRMYRGFTRTQLATPFFDLLNEENCENADPDDLIQMATNDQMKQAFSEIFDILKNRRKK